MESSPDSLVGERLSLAAFSQLAGNLAGYPFVKVIVDRPKGEVHFLNHSRFPFHGEYIAEKFLGISKKELEERIDELNRLFYLAQDRRWYLGIVSLQQGQQGQPSQAQSGGDRFFALETIEIDNMDAEMIRYFYGAVKAHLDPSLPVLFKPASHHQEKLIGEIEPSEMPRVFSHELFAKAQFVALNTGKAKGRVRAFRTEVDYRKALPTLEWYDIIVMHRVPDDVPRVSGIINAHHVTPLSHTNVLAANWRVPNAIQLGIFDRIEREGLDGQWVDYTVETSGREVGLARSEKTVELSARPAWSVQRVKLEEPETTHTPIKALSELRMSDRYRYGTKAANLGELAHVLERGSERLTGFYKVKRPPRPNLLPYLAPRLGLSEAAGSHEINRAAQQFLRSHIRIPRGIAIPFSIQQEVLEASPRIQQTIGKLKMALELGAREIDALCLNLQNFIRAARFPDRTREYIDNQIAEHLSGVSSFVVRSSSNAEDLENFSAAGIYESINHCTTAENIFQSIKEVWASLVSPRSIRLRHEVGISLDDCYMGIIVQEEIPAKMGGVMVTTNPMARGDFRNVYINVSPESVTEIVQGGEQPYQYLYNTVEGGGRTVALGASQELSEERLELLQNLAYAGRLLQSHFSPDYTFNAPVDVEWIESESEGLDQPARLHILQLRPYTTAK